VPGAVDLLSALRAMNVRLAIVTNSVVVEQTAKLGCCAMDGLVDALVTSEGVGVSKPHARIFQHALNELGATASETVMVGDAWSTDVEGALAAGIRCVWFNPRGKSAPSADVRQLSSLEPLDRALGVILD
jgi:HAD superfamily hydrolase (TIGR01549 family)